MCVYLHVRVHVPVYAMYKVCAHLHVFVYIQCIYALYMYNIYCTYIPAVHVEQMLINEYSVSTYT